MDIIIDNLLAYKANRLTLLIAKAKILKNIYLRFKKYYKKDPIYSKIINNLKILVNNHKEPIKDLVIITKISYPF